MKKIICTISAIVMVISLAACESATTPEKPTNNSASSSVANQVSSTSSAIDSEQTIPTVPTQPETTPPVTEPQETMPPVTQPQKPTSPDTAPTEPSTPETPPPEEPDVTQPTEPKPSEPKPNPEPEPIKPVSISANVSGTYHIGDKLSKSDFTVKVTMSDGSIMSNPSGWTVSSLTLSSASNKITVSYQGISTTVTVKASVGAINGMEICKEAIQYLNLNYVSGGNSLTSGTDCSGFTSLIYKKYGISLPRTASGQSEVGTNISLSQAKPGDLYAVKYTNSQYNGHAGIYIGNGWLLSAWPESGVQVTKLSSSDTLHRIFENTYSGTDEQAFKELHRACFSYGLYGTYYRARYYIESGEMWLLGESPFSTEIWNVVSLDVELHNVPNGYEPLVEAWKKEVTDFMILGEEILGYYNGVWYTSTELWEMYCSEQIDRDTYDATTEFYGQFWKESAVITNGLGEVVDLSTYN